MLKRFVLCCFAFSLLAGVSAWAESQHRMITFPLPGKSGVSMVLQRDALKVVMFSALTANKSCKPKSWDDIYVKNTAITAFPQRIGVSPWRENWTLNVCGQLVEVPAQFIPDQDPAKGTTFSVSLPAVKKL